MTQILNRWNGNVIVEGEMGLRELVLHTIKMAKEKGVRANLTHADLTDANLRDADLTDADLTDANLTRANLTRANLTDADLTDANLTRANLTRANLTRANLDYSSWPLWCYSLKAKVDDRISAQLLYHAFAVSVAIPTEEQIEFMERNFHRYAECGGRATLERVKCQPVTTTPAN